MVGDEENVRGARVAVLVEALQDLAHQVVRRRAPREVHLAKVLLRRRVDLRLRRELSQPKVRLGNDLVAVGRVDLLRWYICAHGSLMRPAENQK